MKRVQGHDIYLADTWMEGKATASSPQQQLHLHLTSAAHLAQLPSIIIASNFTALFSMCWQNRYVQLSFNSSIAVVSQYGDRVNEHWP
jgi:hypothetical protein